LQIFTPVDGHSVAIVATLGIAVNGFSAWLLMANSRYDINLRAAFLHMALDAAVSLAVVIGGLSMTWLGWAWIDPAINLVIVLIVLLSAWSLLREALWLALNAVPAHVDLPAVRHYLLQQRGVTAYLVMPGGSPGDAFLRHVSRQLAHDFSIHYVTLQIVRRPWQDEAHSVCGAKNL
jgi:cobalt-zinc-cadmium efflux system protein